MSGNGLKRAENRAASVRLPVNSPSFFMFQACFTPEKHHLRLKTDRLLALGVGIAGTGIYVYNTNAKIHYKLGNRYYEEQKYDNAIASYNKAVAIDAGYVDSYLNLGKVYNDVGSYDFAITTLNKALQIAPDNIPVFLERGETYFYLGNYQKAIDCYLNVLVYEPENELALLWRGKTYLYMNETDNAGDDFLKLLALNPNVAEAFAFQGFLYDKIGEKGLALEAFEKAHSIDPDISVMFYKIAELYRTQNKPDEAFDYYTKTLLLDNQNVNAFYHRGVIYGNKNDYSLSLRDFSSALTIDFNLAISILRYGEALIPNYSADALSMFLKVSAYCVENKISDISLYEPMLYYAIKYSEYSLYDKDIFICTEMLKIYPESAGIFVNRGFANLMLHKTEEAIADYTYALDIEPKNDTALVERGICYLINNQYYEARADFSKELGINANNKDIYEYRAILFDLYNEHELAKLDYEKSFKITNVDHLNHHSKLNSIVVEYINRIKTEGLSIGSKQILSKYVNELLKTAFMVQDIETTLNYYKIINKYNFDNPTPDLITYLISKNYNKSALIFLYQSLSLDFSTEYQKMIQLYEKARSIDSSINENIIGQAYLARAFSFTSTAEYNYAIADIESAKTIDSSTNDKRIGIYYFNRAINESNYDCIIADYETAIKHDISLQKNENAIIGKAYYTRALYKRSATESSVIGDLNIAISIYPGYYAEAHGMIARINSENEAKRRSSSSSGGCFITTATLFVLNKPDDCYELTMFRNFRDNWLTHEPDGNDIIHEYYRIAPAIVKRIDNEKDKTNIYKSIWSDYLNPCMALLEEGNFVECKNKYMSMVIDLSNIYANET